MRRPIVAVVCAGLLAGGGWFLFRSGLSVERVGPKPAAGRKLVVLLHGYGAPGDDLVSLAEEISHALPEVTLLVPQGPSRTGLSGRSWFPQFSAPSREEYIQRLRVEVDGTLAKLWKVINAARAKGVACADITIGGFSQGGRMAAELALRAPPDCRVGGVIVMSGGGMSELSLPAASGEERMRVLVSHGSRDGVVSPSEGAATARHFYAGGHEVSLIAFDGAHEISAVVREAIPKFLSGQTVGSPPQ